MLDQFDFSKLVKSGGRKSACLNQHKLQDLVLTNLQLLLVDSSATSDGRSTVDECRTVYGLEEESSVRVACT